MFETVSLFDSMELDDTERRVASRRALALAHKRVESHLGDFLRGAQSTDEFEQRLALVSEDFNAYVTSATEETGHDNPEHISKALIDHYAAGPPTFINPDEEEEEEDEGDPKDKKASTQVVGRIGAESAANGRIASLRATSWVVESADFLDKTAGPNAFTDQLGAPAPQQTEEAMALGGGGPLQQYGAPGQEPPAMQQAQQLMQHQQEHMNMMPGQQQQQPQQQGMPGQGQGYAGPMPQVPSQQQGAQSLADRINTRGEVGGAELNRATQWDDPQTQGRWASWVIEATSEDGNTGLGGPEPKMDKGKGEPKDPRGYYGDETHPTKDKDPLDPIVMKNADDLKEIGESNSERVKLPSADGDNSGFASGGESSGPHTKTFPKGDQTNPVTHETMGSTFPSPDVVQSAFARI